MPWALVGWLGNALFFTRFLVQWGVSERAGRSLAPRVFWWLSLLGAGCLFGYTAARGEPVLLCGHAVNFAIYARNLALGGPGASRPLDAPVTVALGLCAGLVLLALGAVDLRDGVGASPVWLAASIAGQGIWSTRFVLQWVASERHGESRFPPSFWWLSLAGSALLIAYSLHRTDVVLVAGYLLSPIVQVRNLVLERRHRRAAVARRREWGGRGGPPALRIVARPDDEARAGCARPRGAPRRLSAMAKATAEGLATLEEASGSERRKSERAELVVRVVYQTVDELFSDFARNINEGGIFVASDSPPEAGTAIDIQFRLPGSEDPVRVKGSVVHISTGDDGEPPGMGIEFEDLDGPTRQRINDLVRNLRSAGPR